MTRPWLTKWYLDCMTVRGECFIGYAGRARFGPIRLAVTSSLHGSVSGATTQRWRLMDGSEPERTASGDLQWTSRRLGVQGSWTPATRSVRRVLHESEAGRIVWECTVPGGRARVRVGRAGLEGYGYAEHLSVSGDPAALGLRELLWGHFAGPSNHLVWLAWRGAEPITLVLLNGEEVPDASVPKSDVVAAGGRRLAMGPPRVLRSAVVDETLPRVLRLRVPGALRGMREERWIAPARLVDGTGPPEEGWAIYERVTLP